jgi:hypothetical protein
MVARRASFLCTLEDFYPIPFTDDSLRHAFTRPSMWGSPHPRATIKALPTSLHPPSPLRIIRFHFVRLMRIWADKSAVGAINRPLHCPYARLPTTKSYTLCHSGKYSFQPLSRARMGPQGQLEDPRSLEGGLLIGGWVLHGPGVWRGGDDPDPVLAESRPGLALRG